MLDIILMGYGTLEAGMEMMATNGKDISYIPEPGSEWVTPEVDASLTDADAVAYLKQNDIVIGTLALSPVNMTILLKPVMEIVPNTVGDPHALGYYSYDFRATPGFIHVNPLVDNYLTNNGIRLQTEDRYIAGDPYESATQHEATAMTAMSIPYKPTWISGSGYMMIWSDLTQSKKTVTFKDVAGNTAYVSPVILLDNASQNVIAYLLGGLLIESISATATSLVVRITRQHAPVSILDFTDFAMGWLEEATGGTPDPADPGNPDKIILTLGAGNHTIGVKTSYHGINAGVPFFFPTSAFTMVIGVN